MTAETQTVQRTSLRPSRMYDYLYGKALHPTASTVFNCDVVDPCCCWLFSFCAVCVPSMSKAKEYVERT